MNASRFCFEPCAREDATAQTENGLRFVWVRVKTGEIYQWLDRNEKELPEGVLYVRPIPNDFHA